MKFRVLHPGSILAGQPLPLTAGEIVEVTDEKVIAIYLKALAVELIPDEPRKTSTRRGKKR
jgi:hypothetical protein